MENVIELENRFFALAGEFEHGEMIIWKVANLQML